MGPNPGPPRVLSPARSDLEHCATLPLSQVQDPEHTNAEHKYEQVGDESWVTKGEPPEPGLGHVPKASLGSPIWWTAICQHITNRGLVSMEGKV